MQTRDALHRIAYELAEDMAKDNVRYLEVRYGPILHTEEGLTMWQVNDAVLAGLADAERDHGIRSGVIVCGLRDRFESASLAQAELAASYRGRGVIGFDALRIDKVREKIDESIRKMLAGEFERGKKCRNGICRLLPD